MSETPIFERLRDEQLLSDDFPMEVWCDPKLIPDSYHYKAPPASRQPPLRPKRTT